MTPNDDGPFLLRFFSNPIVGVIGSLASVAGVVLALYFYAQSERRRELTYMVYPAKTIVLKAGQTSRLSITLDNNKFDHDVTAAQIAFWNSGNEPIRREQILKPFIIRTGHTVPIIEARLRKRTREVVDINLGTARIGSGEVSVSWNILEKNDGGVVQIVFAGGIETPITATAVVEGQPRIKGLVLSNENAILSIHRSKLINIIGIVSGLVILSLGGGFLIRKRHVRKINLFDLIVLVFNPMVVLLMGLYLMFHAAPGPPFKF
jgi:ABC-type glycerol-3-phosphate transport system permease component